MNKRTFLVGSLLVALISGPVWGWVDADINGDGFVDGADFNALAQSWDQTGPLLPGNLNNDGGVDKDDLVGVANNWLQESHRIPVGVDMMQTNGAVLSFAGQPIPADFFGPGSLPFEGNIPLQGAPIGTFGPFETGTTDTMIHRTEHSLLLTPPDQTQVGVEIVALSLVSADPIVVDYDPPQSGFWMVEVQLVPSDPLASNPGQMSIDTIDPFFGNCDMTIPVELQLLFTRFGGPPANAAMQLNTELQGAGGLTDVQNSPAGALVVPFMETSFGIGIQLFSPQLFMDLQPATIDPGRPGPNIDPCATVDPAVGSLARFCQLQAGCSVGPGVVVGPFALIGENTVVEADCLIGQGAGVGPESTVGAGVQIGAGTNIAPNCQFGEGSIIGANCFIGFGVVVGPGTEIGHNTVVGDGALIGQDITIESDASIGQSAIIDDGLFLASEAIVADGEHLTGGLFKCTEILSSGNNTGTPHECEDVGGTVFCGGNKVSVSESSSSTHGKEPPGTIVPVSTDPSDPNTPDWVTEAIEDLKNSIHHDPCGSHTYDPNVPIPDRRYDPNDGEYTCGDFAHDAERGLSAIPDPCNPGSPKYPDVTITYYWKYKPNPHYDAAKGDKKGNRKWLSDGAHALIDIHQDGKMVWLEPQTGKAPNPDLDFDDDGEVEYWDNPDKTKPNPPPDNVMSDDHVIIEVYPDRATAQAAGAPTG